MAKPNYSLDQLNFLIVDDNKHIRSLVSNILGALGALNVLEADDGASALEALIEFPADIIICDWNMQPMDGIEFTRKIRSEDGSNPYVPIIMLTGHSGKDHVVEARDAGISEFLAKPFTAKSIYSRIRSIIERPRAFIRTIGEFSYFGPDRRRKRAKAYTGPERREEIQDIPCYDLDELLDGDFDCGAEIEATGNTKSEANSSVKRLRILKEALEEGLVSTEEYETKRQEILKEI